MSSGYGYIGGVQAELRYSGEVVSVGVRSCWVNDGGYVEVMIGGLPGHDKLVLLDIGDDDARQLAKALKEAARYENT